MARSLRIQYPGAYYHVMARGNRREAVFLDVEDRRFFLKTLAEACGRTGWRIHAWVLMSNHYHLLIETPEPNLVDGMKWFQNTVTRRFNVRHSQWGRLFGDRYKAVLVEGHARFYYETLVDYIHLNPVRAGLIKPGKAESVLDFPWSSAAGAYALAPRKRAPWMAAAAGLEMLGFADTAAGRRRMIEHLDKRAEEECTEECGVPPLPGEADGRASHLRRGWYWGSQAFSEGLLKLAAPALRQAKSRAKLESPQHRAHGQRQAEIWLEKALKRCGLSEAQLRESSGSDPRKAAIAWMLWSNTTVSQTWLAERLWMRSASNVSRVLGLAQWPASGKRLPARLRAFIEKGMAEDGK